LSQFEAVNILNTIPAVKFCIQLAITVTFIEHALSYGQLQPSNLNQSVDELAKAGHFIFLREQIKEVSPSTAVEEVRSLLYDLIGGVIDQARSSS